MELGNFQKYANPPPSILQEVEFLSANKMMVVPYLARLLIKVPLLPFSPNLMRARLAIKERTGTGTEVTIPILTVTAAGAIGGAIGFAPTNVAIMVTDGMANHMGAVSLMIKMKIYFSI